MWCFHFVFVFFIQVLAQTDSSPTSPASAPTTTAAATMFTIQFIVGLSVTGGVALMVILFMSITACQRAYKNRPKKNVPKKEIEKKDVEKKDVEKKEVEKTVEAPIEIIVSK